LYDSVAKAGRLRSAICCARPEAEPWRCSDRLQNLVPALTACTRDRFFVCKFRACSTSVNELGFGDVGRGRTRSGLTLAISKLAIIKCNRQSGVFKRSLRALFFSFPKRVAEGLLSASLGRPSSQGVLLRRVSVWGELLGRPLSRSDLYPLPFSFCRCFLSRRGLPTHERPSFSAYELHRRAAALAVSGSPTLALAVLRYLPSLRYRQRAVLCRGTALPGRHATITMTPQPCSRYSLHSGFGAPVIVRMETLRRATLLFAKIRRREQSCSQNSTRAQSVSGASGLAYV